MQDRHVLITGGAGALGTAVTLAALERGARVTVPYHSGEEAKRLTDTVGRDRTGSVLLVRADLRDESVVARMIDAMDTCDALIHLVGGFSMGPTHTLTQEDWRFQHDLTLLTTFLCCKHALRRMRDQSYGRIVTIGSRAAVDPTADLAAYATAKAGVVALTRVIADETKGQNITANCVLPSTIDTPANRKAMGEENAHKWVKPESLAQTIVSLASEGARDVRGAVIPVYGDA